MVARWKKMKGDEKVKKEITHWKERRDRQTDRERERENLLWELAYVAPEINSII